MKRRQASNSYRTKDYTHNPKVTNSHSNKNHIRKKCRTYNELRHTPAPHTTRKQEGQGFYNQPQIIMRKTTLFLTLLVLTIFLFSGVNTNYQGTSFGFRAIAYVVNCSIQSIVENSNYAYVSGVNVYYNNASSGSFMVNVSASTEENATIENVTFPDTVSSGGAVFSEPYNWTYNWDTYDTSDYAPATVYCYNNWSTDYPCTTSSDNCNMTNFYVYIDNTPPSSGFVAYKNGSQRTLYLIVNLSSGSDSGSGLNTAQLYKSNATLSSGVCSGWSSWYAVGNDSVDKVFINDTDVESGYCYKYIYNVSDRVSNIVSYSSSNITKVDNVSPSWVSYSVEGCDYLSGNDCWVKSGTVFNVLVRAYDNLSTLSDQYLAFANLSCSPNYCGCDWDAYCDSGNEIKSRIFSDSRVFYDYMWNDNYLNITNSSCIEVGGCSNDYEYENWSVRVGSLEKNYRIYVYEYDEAGNDLNYTFINYYLRIDNSDPSTSASAVDNSSASYTFGTWTNSAYVNVSLSCDDSASGCGVTYYCVDTSNSCSPSSVYSGVVQVSGDGIHYIRFYSVDNVGNVEDTQDRTVMIDTTAPVVSYSSNSESPGAVVSRNWSFINVSVSENVTNCTLNWNLIVYQMLQENDTVWYLNVTNQSDNVYYYNVSCVDLANNTGYSTTRNITIDTMPPSCSLEGISEGSDFAFVSGTTLYYNNASSGSFVVNVSVSDSGSGVNYSLFPDTVSSGGSDSSLPFSWSYSWDSSDGSNYSDSIIYCYDYADNSNTTTFSVIIDITPPSGGYIDYENGSINKNWTLVSVDEGSDTQSGISDGSASLQLYVSNTSLSGGVCNDSTWSSWYSFGSQNTSTAQVNVTNLQSGYCYKFIYNVSDNVHNFVSYSSSNVIEVDSTPPYTYDDSPTPIYWYINANANITLTCTDDTGCNRTYYCIYDIGDSPCTDFSVNYANITYVLVSCSNNSACERKIRYYSIDDAGNTEQYRESNPIYIVHNSSVNGTEAYKCNITSSSYVRNGLCGGCYIENSTVINSTLLELSQYRYHCRIVNSTVINVNVTNAEIYNSYVDPTTIVDSLIQNSTIINSSVESSVIINSSFSNCGFFSVLAGSIYDNVLSAGVILYNNSRYYSPRNLSDICAGVSPTPKGYLTIEPDVAKNSSSVTFKYYGFGTGYEVRVDKSSFDVLGGNLSLLDNGLSPDEVKDDAVYSGTALVNKLTTGYVTVVAYVNDNLGNSFVVTKTLFLDNEPPNATLLINNNDTTTITRHVVLKLNYTDNYNVSKCRFANEDLNFSSWYNCQETIPWILSSGNGSKTVYAEIRDFAGNSIIVNDTINLMEGAYDLTPPENLTVYDDGNWTNNNNSLHCSWHAFDRESKVFYYYRIVGQTNWVYAGENEEATVTNLSLSEGSTYYCEVIAQNSYFVNSSSQQSDGITVDITAPIINSINASVYNNTWTNQNNIQFNWSGYDPVSSGVSSGIEAYSYILDSIENTIPDEIPEGNLENLSSETTHTYSYVSDGIHYFHVRAKDRAGNWGLTKHYVVKVDTIPPTAPYMHNPNVTASSSSILFSWNESTDPTLYGNSSGVYRYLINITYTNGTEVVSDWVYGLSYNFTSAQNGITYHASVKAQDYAGNLGPSSDTAVLFDNQPPQITFKKPSSTGAVVVLDPILVLETDENATCYYNGTRFFFTNSTHHETKVYVSNGDVSYDIVCVDSVGNSRADTINFHVDTTLTPDSISIQGLSSYFINYPVSFNVIVEGSSTKLGELRKQDFRVVLNSTSLNDFTIRDLGAGNYSISFMAPVEAGNYTLTVYAGGASDSSVLSIEETGLIVKITSSTNQTLTTNKMVYGKSNQLTVGLASDSSSVSTVANSTTLQLESDITGRTYIFVTKQNANPRSRENYLIKKTFLDLINPSFGYSIDRKKFYINTELNYPGIVILSNDTLRRGVNNVVIKSVGYDPDGNLVIVVQAT